jgi:hypothetical protein
LVAYQVVEHEAELEEHAIQTPFDRMNAVLQVRAILVAEQVAAPAGQMIHAALTIEYPVLQVEIAVYEVQVATFLGQA